MKRLISTTELEASIRATMGMASLACAPILIIVGEAQGNSMTQFTLDFRGNGLRPEDWANVLVTMGENMQEAINKEKREEEAEKMSKEDLAEWDATIDKLLKGEGA